MKKDVLPTDFKKFIHRDSKGERYCLYPFVDCPKDLQEKIVKYLREYRQDLVQDEEMFQHRILPSLIVKLAVTDDDKPNFDKYPYSDRLTRGK